MSFKQGLAQEITVVGTAEAELQSDGTIEVEATTVADSKAPFPDCSWIKVVGQVNGVAKEFLVPAFELTEA